MRRASLSIRTRFVLLSILTVAGACGVAGLSAWRGVGRAIEDRLVHGAVRDAAGLIERLSLPVSHGVLEQIGTLLDGELIAVNAEGAVVAATIPARQARRLPSRSPGNSAARPLTLGTQRFLAGQAPIRAGGVAREDARQLILLVPVQIVRRAKRRVAGQVALIALVAMGVAVGIAFLASRSITAPLRDLTREMVRISQNGLDTKSERRDARRQTPQSKDESPPEPPEVASLRASFHHLLDSLSQAQDRLERSAQLAAVGKVAVSAAHELRNPLSAIRMHVRVLADDVDDTETVDVIRREIERMDLYLEELMSLRPEESGDAPPARRHDVSPVDLVEAVRSVLSLLAPRCRHAGIRVQVDADAPPDPALAEERRLRQVVINLLINAMDAMPSGGTLRVSCRNTPEGGTVECCVQDTGTGLPPGGEQRVFDAFVTGKPHGAGLGLYICRRIVEQYGGSMSARNTERGAEISFRLPRA